MCYHLQVRADGGQYESVGVQCLPLGTPYGQVGVQSRFQALAHFLCYVIVQVLRMDPQQVHDGVVLLRVNNLEKIGVAVL